MKIKFIGAAREVTGSKHLITLDNGKKILLDCGMFQGKGLETDAMNRNTMVDPKEVDCIIASHAHIDHTGLIPYFYANGFRGDVICTHATRDLCAIMLPDSGFIQENDTHWFNKKRVRQGLPWVKPIYTEKDARACMECFVSYGYNRYYTILDGVRVMFTNSGHMLGSAVVNLEITENGKTTRIAYTGDIGRKSSYLLKSPEPFPQCDYLITESTYGDRLHGNKVDAENKLLYVVNHTCCEKKGKLIIPSFAIGRTQELIYMLNKYNNEKKLPRISVFVDSPLAINATEIFKLNLNLFNDDVAETLEKDSDPFGFNTLYYITNVEQSKKLNDRKEPCIVISASGMMEAGRVKHHIANSVDNPKNTILSVGYCAPETLGAKIVRGDKDISIFGFPHRVNSEVFSIDAFSGHGDYEEMSDYIACQEAKQLKKLFIVHGDYKAQQFYADVLGKKGFKNIEIPAAGEEFEL